MRRKSVLDPIIETKSGASGFELNRQSKLGLRAVAGDLKYSDRCLLSGNEPCPRSDLPITIGFHSNGEWRSRPWSQTADNLNALRGSRRLTTSGRPAHPQPPQNHSRLRRKADRAFCRRLGINPHRFALVGVIVAIAAARGLEVTDEGVENQDQLAGLDKLGNRWGRAVHFARPIQPAGMDPVRGPVIRLADRVIH